MDDLIKVKVSVEKKDSPIQRQSPGGLGIWKNCQFYFDDEINQFDYWVVIDNLGLSEIVKCPKGNTLLLTGEPPSKKVYTKEFLRQFGHIITNVRDIQGQNVSYGQTAITWHVGRQIRDGKSVSFSMGYDYWNSLESLPKTKNISVITSNKKITEGQRQRLVFIEKLKEYFKDKIDIFGLGFNEIPDKWDAIAKYKYHIALENCSYPDYWTEKLSDCYLGLAYPIYYGCPNIADYFPQGSYATINILDTQGSIKKIEELLESDTYQVNAALVKQAQDLVLNKYNFFPLVTDFINANFAKSPKQNVVLKPQKKVKKFTIKRKVNEFRHWVVILIRRFR